MSAMRGPIFVWGVPERVCPISNLPADTLRYRIRLRQKHWGMVLVLTPAGVRQFALEDQGEQWKLGPETGRNYRQQL